MSVEQDGLDVRQERVIPIQVRPPRLHHSDLRIGEMVDDLHQPILWWQEVGVEDGDELALTGPKPIRKCPSFIASAIGSVDISDVMPKLAVTLHDFTCYL